jgi:hypothetical protein
MVIPVKFKIGRIKIKGFVKSSMGIGMKQYAVIVGALFQYPVEGAHRKDTFGIHPVHEFYTVHV